MNKHSEAAELFFRIQLSEWEQLKIAYNSLTSVQEKTFSYDDYKIIVQHNPNRIKSSSADVKNISENKELCFLCEKNLPEKQKGIMLLGKYILLCNPYPIFPEHFTIASLAHQPQEIKNSFKDFLALSKMLGGSYSLIYNGPECGASVPFHLHFQAGTKNIMPLENEIQQMESKSGNSLVESENISVSFIDDKIRKMIYIKSSMPELLIEVFGIIFDELNSISSTVKEPMLNIIISFDKKTGWKIIIFLRSKHRPDIFYKQDETRMLVSPAAVDLGGILILPEKKDFEKINGQLVQEIFREVSPGRNIFDDLFSNIKKKTGTIN